MHSTEKNLITVFCQRYSHPATRLQSWFDLNNKQVMATQKLIICAEPSNFLGKNSFGT